MTSEFLSEDGWSGRVEVGASKDLQGGLGLSTSLDVSGLGGSAQTVSGGLRVALQFWAQRQAPVRVRQEIRIEARMQPVKR